jgi:hypothetical protein
MDHHADDGVILFVGVDTLCVATSPSGTHVAVVEVRAVTFVTSFVGIVVLLYRYMLLCMSICRHASMYQDSTQASKYQSASIYLQSRMLTRYAGRACI